MLLVTNAPTAEPISFILLIKLAQKHVAVAFILIIQLKLVMHALIPTVLLVLELIHALLVKLGGMLTQMEPDVLVLLVEELALLGLTQFGWLENKHAKKIIVSLVYTKLD